MGTLEWLQNKYNVDPNKKGVIKLHISRWGSMPRIYSRLGFRLGAEVGVETGRFSKALCMGNIRLKLYSIDPWDADPEYKPEKPQKEFDEMYATTRKRLAPYNCHIIRAYSMDAVRWFDDNTLDFVFIDANHDYKHFTEDLREWHKKVRVGGIVSGHDWVNGCNGLAFGVKQRMWEWIDENPDKQLFIFNKRGCPSWMYVK